MHTNPEQPDARANLVMASSFAGYDPRPETLDLPAALKEQVQTVVIDLDQWLDAMRVPGGYGGPVLHWQGDSPQFHGPGLDWRYEGIIIGYLNLWHGTSNPTWLEKARCAGDDLIAGQLLSGNFRNSSFEMNPNTGGTPHEAAACLGLIRLAFVLRSLNDPDWSKYFQVVVLNIQEYHIQYLWDQRKRVFFDGPNAPSVSPDRLAPLAEVLFSLTRLTGETTWINPYGFGCLDAILSHQVDSGDLEGAIYFRSSQGSNEGRFFPLSIARCIPALILGYAWSLENRYIEAAEKAGAILVKIQRSDGSFPQVIYENGSRNLWPTWIAPAGDILRAIAQLQDVGYHSRILLGLEWLLSGKMEGGAIRTAVGFGRSKIPPRANDPRDHIPCTGWVDKAFRFLTSIVDPCEMELKIERIKNIA